MKSVAWLALAGGLAWCGMAHAQARPAITGVAFARFYTTDPAGAQKFYGGTLGFERHEVGGEWVYPVNRLQWIEVTPAPPPQANVRLAAVAFTTRDAAGLETYLRAKGVAIAEPLRAGEFGVRDPEGNLVIFVQSGMGPLEGASVASPRAASGRIIHVGFQVQSREKEDAFWRGVLGFKPYWHGGAKNDTDVDYASLQVPEGSDWLEYMLNRPADAGLKEHGGMDHVSLGVEAMGPVVQRLAENGCEGANCSASKIGRDGKVQLNLFDPDRTRVELMEFRPSGTTCCSPFLGKHPTGTEEQ